jgi:succinoglycan biosynthesis protein ExoA
MMLVSVILPVRNEAAFIEGTLRAVLAQDYPREKLEVLVVDGMSEDGTREVAQRLATDDRRLQLLDNPRRIIPAALNIGIRAARGDILVRVDGHGVVPEDYVSECVRQVQAAENGDRPTAVGGAWDCIGRGRVGRAIAMATSSSLGVGNARYRTMRPAAAPADRAAGREPVETDSVPFWAMRREVFARLGLFHEEMLCHEDYEFNYRLRRAGGRVLLLPWLRAKYYVRPTLSRLAAQYVNYGFWKGRFLRQHPESLRARHLAPPLLLAGLALGILGTIFFGRTGAMILAVMAGAYAGFLLAASAVLAGWGREYGKPETRDWRPEKDSSTVQRFDGSTLQTILLLPVVLATLHLCWGAGVWAGLIRGPVKGEPPPLDSRGCVAGSPKPLGKAST